MRQFLEKILQEAGELVVSFFGTDCVEYIKQGGAMDVVTRADLVANEHIIKAIQKTFPTHGIISEETGMFQKEAEYIWTVDPIDGTANFAKGLPIFMVMISVIQNNRPILSGLYHPIYRDLAIAERGNGAWLNGLPIHCSGTSLLSESFGCASTVVNAKMIHFYQATLDGYAKLKVGAFGCAAYTGLAVASAKRDWLVTFHRNVWDIAPIALLMEEAGCVITNTQGQPWKPGDDIVAAPASIHHELITILLSRMPDMDHHCQKK